MCLKLKTTHKNVLIALEIYLFLMALGLLYFLLS